MLTTNPCNAQPSFSWFTIKENHTVQIRVDIFLSSTCPYCKKLDQYYMAIAKQNPWIEMHRHVINQDKMALDTFYQFLKNQHSQDFSVPAVFFCKTHWIGVARDKQAADDLLKAMNYCRIEITKQKKLHSSTVQVLQQKANTRWYEATIAPQSSPWILMLTMAMTEAITLGTVGIIVCLSSFIIGLKTRKQQIASWLLFLLGMGYAHYVQQVSRPNGYEILTLLRVPVALIGLGLVTYILCYHPALRAKKRALPLIICALWILLTGAAIQCYQQVPMPNFSLIFHQWVAAQQVALLKQYLYASLYQIVYTGIIGFMTLLFMALFKNICQRLKCERIVDEFAWQYVLLTGFALLFYPVIFQYKWMGFLSLILVMISSVWRDKLCSKPL